MDGAIQYTNTTAGVNNDQTITTTLQGNLNTPVEINDADGNPTGSYSGTWGITGYHPYWETEYSARIEDEECDNGGDTDHGCSYMCKVETGWTCYHYYHHLTGLEVPYFTSICEETDLPTLDPDVDRRRLSPDDFDKHGRRLNHKPRQAYLVELPDNLHEMRTGKHTLKFDPKMGLNGQIRVIENGSCENCYGFVMAYSRDEATLANWVYY